MFTTLEQYERACNKLCTRAQRIGWNSKLLAPSALYAGSGDVPDVSSAAQMVEAHFRVIAERFRRCLRFSMLFSRAMRDLVLRVSLLLPDALVHFPPTIEVSTGRYMEVYEAVEKEVEMMKATLEAQRLALAAREASRRLKDELINVSSQRSTSAVVFDEEAVVAVVDKHITDLTARLASALARCRFIEVCTVILQGLNAMHPDCVLEKGTTMPLLMDVIATVNRQSSMLTPQGATAAAAASRTLFPEPFVPHRDDLEVCSPLEMAAAQDDLVRVSANIRECLRGERLPLRLPLQGTEPCLRRLLAHFAELHNRRAVLLEHVEYDINFKLVSDAVSDAYLELMMVAEEALLLAAELLSTQAQRSTIIRWVRRRNDLLGTPSPSNATLASWMESDRSVDNTDQLAQLVHKNAAVLEERTSALSEMAAELHDLIDGVDDADGFEAMSTTPSTLLISCGAGPLKQKERLMQLSRTCAANHQLTLLSISGFGEASASTRHSPEKARDLLDARQRAAHTNKYTLNELKDASLELQGLLEDVVAVQQKIPLQLRVIQAEQQEGAEQSSNVDAAAGARDQDALGQVQLFGPSSHKVKAYEARVFLQHVQLLVDKGMLVYANGKHMAHLSGEDVVQRLPLVDSTAKDTDGDGGDTFAAEFLKEMAPYCCKLSADLNTLVFSSRYSDQAGPLTTLMVGLDSIEHVKEGPTMGHGLSRVHSLDIHLNNVWATKYPSPHLHQFDRCLRVVFLSTLERREWSGVLSELVQNVANVHFLMERLSVSHATIRQ